jgi:T-complex protein 10 C-terminus
MRIFLTIRKLLLMGKEQMKKMRYLLLGICTLGLLQVKLLAADVQQGAANKAEEGTSVQIMPDGTKMIQHSDGTFIQINPDGSKMIKQPDGTSVLVKPDGSKTIKKPDGTTIEVKPGG